MLDYGCSRKYALLLKEALDSFEVESATVKVNLTARWKDALSTFGSRHFVEALIHLQRTRRQSLLKLHLPSRRLRKSYRVPQATLSSTSM